VIVMMKIATLILKLMNYEQIELLDEPFYGFCYECGIEKQVDFYAQRGDVIHPSLYVECKLRKRIATWSLFREVEKQAKLEGKTPLLILKEKNKKGELAVLRLSDFVELLDTAKNR